MFKFTFRFDVGNSEDVQADKIEVYASPTAFNTGNLPPVLTELPADATSYEVTLEDDEALKATFYRFAYVFGSQRTFSPLYRGPRMSDYDDFDMHLGVLFADGIPSDMPFPSVIGKLTHSRSPVSFSVSDDRLDLFQIIGDSIVLKASPSFESATEVVVRMAVHLGAITLYKDFQIPYTGRAYVPSTVQRDNQYILINGMTGIDFAG